MKLLYPEIETWVYNTQKRDPSINMLRVSLSLPGALKMPRVVFPPESCHHTWRGPNHYFFVTPLAVKQTDVQVSLSNAFSLAEVWAGFTV